MKAALLDTMEKVLKLTAESSDKPRPSSLNFAITNGQVVIATRFRNSNMEEPPSLYYSKRPRYKCHNDKEDYTETCVSHHII